MNHSGLGDGARSFVYAARKNNGSSRFQRLFNLTVRHTYYTLNNGLCPDFRAVPTPATAKLMASLGLAFKDEGTGFSVFYQTGMLEGIYAYLRRQAADAPENHPGYWSRLTFLMKVVNPEFLGVTALPIEVTPVRWNLYGCNRDAHLVETDGEEEVAVLSRGDFMTGDALYRLVGNELDLNVPDETARVTISDISGAVVLEWPPEPDDKLLERGAGAFGNKHVIIDLGVLPHDLYTITIEDSKFKSIGAPIYPRTVLYVPAAGDSMVLLDMLFTQPTPEPGGVYPIPPLFRERTDSAEIGDKAYELRFDARQTYWKYYVISQAPGRLTDLKIEGNGARFDEQRAPEPLPDGSRARLFTSDTTLPLRQKSAQRFQLTGSRRDPGGQDNAIVRLRLPVAPAAPVWPVEDNGDSSTGTSEIFVYV